MLVTTFRLLLTTVSTAGLLYDFVMHVREDSFWLKEMKPIHHFSDSAVRPEIKERKRTARNSLLLYREMWFLDLGLSIAQRVTERNFVTGESLTGFDQRMLTLWRNQRQGE